jgi:hypothetical protein
MLYPFSNKVRFVDMAIVYMYTNLFTTYRQLWPSARLHTHHEREKKGAHNHRRDMELSVLRQKMHFSVMRRLGPLAISEDVLTWGQSPVASKILF